jgi:N-acylglucosamine-6-phosphate 2-epimerase
MTLFEQLRGGLVVSCQAKEGSPLRDPHVLAALAQAAERGGAAGIRADGPAHIAAIRAAVALPIIGICKQDLAGTPVYITPTLESAESVVAAGAHLLAVQATAHPRLHGQSAAEFIQLCKATFKIPVMADISTLQEGIEAARAGADLIATTLAGYTPYSRQLDGPDFELIRELAANVSAPVVAEGRIATPADLRRAFDLGAHAVVVGTAITAVDWITRRFADATPASSR